jgi:acyl-CoA reductase-like NAD-dependent aldehyde dehydrogenase
MTTGETPIEREPETEMGTVSTATPTTLNQAIDDLRAGLPSWIALPASQRAALLRAARHRVVPESEGITAATCTAKRISRGSRYAGEVTADLANVATGLKASETVLDRIAGGRDLLPGSALRARPDGQVEARVMPASAADRALSGLLGGLRVDVRMQPGQTVADTLAGAAAPYRGGTFPHPGVALVLGGGNFANMPVLDVLHVLLAEGCVALLKLNPVNDYLGPFLERIFAEFVEHGWLRVVHGGADVARDLAYDPRIDRIHMTGGKSTYDALVWGEDALAEQRRAQGTPLLDKPFSAELGGVGPCIVVPGPWSAADIRRQAGRICWQKLYNAGHVCSATQILIVPEGWQHTDALLDEIRRLMAELPPRPPYYPRTQERLDRALADCPQVEALQPPDRRLIATGLDPDSDARLFTEEVFADLLGVVRLSAPSVPDYLDRAVAFANDRLAGDLAAMLLAHPRTMREHGGAVEQAIDDLRYGTVSLNESPVMAVAANGYGTWGAYPGNTPDDIGSGTGFVGNALLFEAPQKTVVRAAFHPPLKPLTDATHLQTKAFNGGTLRLVANDDLRAFPSVLLAALRG